MDRNIPRGRERLRSDWQLEGCDVDGEKVLHSWATCGPELVPVSVIWLGDGSGRDTLGWGPLVAHPRDVVLIVFVVRAEHM
jgi:hypothetical protein